MPGTIENQYVSTRDIVTLAIASSYRVTYDWTLIHVRGTNTNIVEKAISETKTNPPSCWRGIAIAGAYYMPRLWANNGLLAESETNELFK